MSNEKTERAETDGTKATPTITIAEKQADDKESTPTITIAEKNDSGDRS